MLTTRRRQRLLRCVNWTVLEATLAGLELQEHTVEPSLLAVYRVPWMETASKARAAMVRSALRARLCAPLRMKR